MTSAERCVGALTIGQAPRPDLVGSLNSLLPPDCRLVEAGALDGLLAMDLPGDSNGDYLLTTRLRDGTLVKVQESFLAEKLQNALHRLEAAGVVATILLCAGTFAEVRGTRPLYKPFVLARDTVRLLGMHSLGLIVPIPEQEAPVHARWSRAGFKPHVWTADLGQQDAQFLRNLQRRTEERDLDCIMLDYVGHPAQQVLALQRATSLPVIDLGQLAVTICAGSL